MTKEELINQLKPFYKKRAVAATVYFIMKDGDGVRLKLADIESDAQPDILNQYLSFLQTNIIEDEDKSLMPLSASDDRKNVVYQYDLDEVPEELSIIDLILEDDECQPFSFRKDDISDLQGFLILIGNNQNQLVLYKKHYPISLFKRDSVLSFKVGTRLVKLEKDVLKLNESFDFFQLNGKLFIMNINTLERFFSFHDIIVKKAKEGMATIKNAKIVDNPEELEELLSDVSFARKLTKVTTESPVLGEISTKDIIEFTKTHPSLAGKFQYNKRETRIHLHTKTSKNLFLKLLNDDFLLSELTKRHYESMAKDHI